MRNSRLIMPLQSDSDIIGFCNENQVTIHQFFILHKRSGKEVHDDFDLELIKIELNKFRDGNL